MLGASATCVLPEKKHFVLLPSLFPLLPVVAAGRSRKTEAEQAVCLVAPHTRDEALRGLAPGRVDAQDVESEGEGEGEGEPGPEAEAETVRDGSQLGVPLIWAEGPEVQSREWLNMFGTLVKGQVAQVIDFFPGSGTLALAACRHGHSYLGLVSTEAQKSICRQQILLSITLELITNKQDGFKCLRLLSRERSLGAGTAEAANVAPPPAQAPEAESAEDAESNSSTGSESGDGADE